MKSPIAALSLSAALLAGCVQPVVVQRPAPAAEAQDEVLAPPLPRFLSIADCEQAYGPGACGTGAVVYASAGIAAPPDAQTWFIPVGFSVMTGVLTHAYFAPPARYVVGIPYQVYVTPVVIERYRVVTPYAIERYHAAPPMVREGLMRRGPAVYDVNRRVIVDRPLPPVRGNSDPRRTIQDVPPHPQQPGQPQPVRPGSPGSMQPPGQLQPGQAPPGRPGQQLPPSAVTPPSTPAAPMAPQPGGPRSQPLQAPTPPQQAPQPQPAQPPQPVKRPPPAPAAAPAPAPKVVKCTAKDRPVFEASGSCPGGSRPLPSR